MNLTQTIPRNFATENLETILHSMSSENKKQQELIFPVGMIESYCRLRCYPCYRYAHNLKKQPYMRARIDEFTVEYLVITEPEGACVCQISVHGKLIYTRPDNPVGTIRVL